MPIDFHERKRRFLKYWEPRHQNKWRYVLAYALLYSLVLTFVPLLLEMVQSVQSQRDPWQSVYLDWALAFLISLAYESWAWQQNEKRYRKYLQESFSKENRTFS